MELTALCMWDIKDPGSFFPMGIPKCPASCTEKTPFPVSPQGRSGLKSNMGPWVTQMVSNLPAMQGPRFDP